MAAVALPLSVVPTFLANYLFDFRLNIISLFALSLVIGVLVDDAIVEVENMIRHLRMGKAAYVAVKMEAADEIRAGCRRDYFYPNRCVFTNCIYGRRCRSVFSAVWLDSRPRYFCVIARRSFDYADDGSEILPPEKQHSKNKVSRWDGISNWLRGPSIIAGSR